MRFARVMSMCALGALALAACGTAAKPLAGSPAALAERGPGVHARVDDPRAGHYRCLLAHHLRATEPAGTQFPEIQVGRPGVGPLIEFLATPGAAQYAQISGQEQGAEVIGSALLYPNRASDSLLNVVESCTALGVKG
jgi:hypothetical protein